MSSISGVLTPSDKHSATDSNHTILLSTQGLRALLPYRHSSSTGIYQNQHNSGFGLQLPLQHLSSIQTIQKILQTITFTTHGELHYSLHLHHHGSIQKKWYVYLFVSTALLSQPIAKIMHYRQQLCSHLSQHHIRFTDLNTTDFLIFLRTLISPNQEGLDNVGLIDIHNKAFHEIIPNPGTVFSLFPTYIDILAPNALGLFRKTRLSLNHVITPNHTALWEALHGLLQCLKQDWLLSLTIHAHRSWAHFALFTPPDQSVKENIITHRHYAAYGLHLQASKTPLRDFLISLPF